MEKSKGIEDMWKEEIEEMLSKAKTKKDMKDIGSKINCAIDNNYKVDYTDYQIRAAMKDAEISKQPEYKNIETGVKA